jgi:excisionase family DNA binding protein
MRVASEYVTVAQLAKLAGKHRKSIAMLCKRRRLPCEKVGKRYLIPVSAAQVFLQIVAAQRELKRLAEEEASDEAGSH